MNREDMQKLIGGYATGSLTGEETRQLFEAALEDQELFDALQREQALKELFDDPFSREQVRRAAAESLPQPKSSPRAKSVWFRRPWIWAAGASVATAAVLLVVLIQTNQNRPAVKQLAEIHREAAPPAAAPPQPAAPPPVTATEPPARRAAPQSLAPKNLASKSVATKKDEPLEASAALPPSQEPAQRQQPQQDQFEKQQKALRDNVTLVPSPAAPAPQQSQGQLAAHQQTFVAPAGVAGQSPAQGPAQSSEVAGALRPQRAKATAATAALPELAFRSARPYSLSKRTADGSYFNLPADATVHSGDLLRLTISPRASGPLVLWEWDTNTGSWTRLFPAEGSTMQVRAFEPYIVPIDIVVKPGERLRTTVGSVSTDIPLVVR